MEGETIYYVGPTPAQPRAVIGSAGPTTSERMDVYTPALLEKGLVGMIGKGYRSTEVIEQLSSISALFCGNWWCWGVAFKNNQINGCCGVSDLGPEAIHRIEVVDFPAVVINDSFGNDWYKQSK